MGVGGGGVTTGGKREKKESDQPPLWLSPTDLSFVKPSNFVLSQTARIWPLIFLYTAKSNNQTDPRANEGCNWGRENRQKPCKGTWVCFSLPLNTPLGPYWGCVLPVSRRQLSLSCASDFCQVLYKCSWARELQHYSFLTSKKRWDNTRERTGLEFAKSQRAVENTGNWLWNHLWWCRNDPRVKG